MTRIAGVDLSLAATGVAVLAVTGGQAKASTVTIPSTGRRGDTLLERDTRIQLIVDAVRIAAASAHLVVMEGPSIMSQGGSNWDRAGLWWRVFEALRPVAPIAVAAPTVVKKFAAGKGNADKTRVAAGMTRLWPDVEPSNDNEFDALALATLGAVRLDLLQPTNAAQRDALAKVEWPANLADAIAAAAEDSDWIAQDTQFDRTQDATDRETA